MPNVMYAEWQEEVYSQNIVCAECRYAECRYVECRGAPIARQKNIIVLENGAIYQDIETVYIFVELED
jgi:hypothetical protein